MPTLTQLEYLVAVDKHKHFGRASKHCNVSQPSLSAQILKIEEELGVIVFDRSKKPILTTEMGQKVIEQAKKILSEHQRLLNLNLSSEKLQGKFHLSVIPTLSAYIVPLFLQSFSKKYPDVHLTISEHTTDEIINLLQEDKIDCGLLATPLNTNQVFESVLFYEPFYAFVSKDHDFYKKQNLSVKELNGETLWILNEGHCFRDQVLEICNLKNKNQVLENVNFESGNLETLKNLIRKAEGYTLLPYLSTLNLSKDEIQKNLKPFKKPVPTREISLVYSRQINKEFLIKALMEEIKLNLPQELTQIKKNQVEVVPF